MFQNNFLSSNPVFPPTLLIKSSFFEAHLLYYKRISSTSPSHKVACDEFPTVTTAFTFQPFPHTIVVTVLAIAATAAAILIYHYLLSTCCRRRSPAVSTRRDIRAHPVAEDVLKSLPVRVYAIKHRGSFREDQTECSVCLGELDEGDQVRLLPTCRHVFHLQCIDQWFASHSSCPICRLEITAPSSPHLVLQVADNVPQIQALSVSVSDEASDCGRIRSKTLLNRCTSLFSTIERKSPRPNMRLNRSFSMDTSRLSDKKHVDLEVGIPAEAPGVNYDTSI